MQYYRLLGLPLALGIILFALVYLLTHPPTDTAKSEMSVTKDQTANSYSTPEATVMPPLEKQLGRLFVIGHWANTPVASTTKLISQYNLGGVIIMNAPEDPSEIATWTKEWQEAVDYPLMIAIDQEGGTVSRLKGPDFIQTAQPNITTTKRAYEVGKVRGVELSSLGINTNFAPVVETSVNSWGFLHRRVFRDPNNIVSLATAMLKGLNESGVQGVIKHYPGHEDEPTDSHEALPVVELAGTTFADHTKHFNKLITSGNAPILMTAHVLVPDLDPQYPATLSKHILTDELRQNQGFDGVIITDDMTMDAIADRFSTASATELALQAGADMILFAAEPKEISTVFPAMLNAVTVGELPEMTITKHYQRVEALLAN